MFYSNLTIQNFRAIESLEIRGLKRINLFGGRNSSGKSSILEAIFLNVGAPRPENLLRLHQIRGTSIEVNPERQIIRANLGLLFTNQDTSKSISIVGESQTGQLRRVELEMEEELQLGLGMSREASSGQSQSRLTAPTRHMRARYRLEQDGKVLESVLSARQEGQEQTYLKELVPFPDAIFMIAGHSYSDDENAKRLSSLLKTKSEGSVVKSLKILEPGLNGLQVLSEGDASLIHCDFESASELIPISVVGEGFKRLASILLIISTSKNGFVLIDEIENGFHHSVLARVMLAIDEFATLYDCQVFATTHSGELAEAAAKSLDRADFRFYRVERTGRNVRAVDYDADELLSSLNTGIEVR